MGFFRKTQHNASKPREATLPESDLEGRSRPRSNNCVELGTIGYTNLTRDGKHGLFEPALQIATETGRPIFANFAEWPGCAGCKDAGAIFADNAIRKAAEEVFVPVAFNTWDRDDPERNQAMLSWGAGLAAS